MIINGFTVSSLFFSIMLTIVFFSKERVKNKETTLYSYILVVNVIMGSFATLSFFSIRYLTDYFINEIANKMLLFSYTTWMFIFTLYLFSISKKFLGRTKEQRKIRYILADICYVLLSLFAIILPIEYVNEYNKVYSFGPCTKMLYIATAICFMVWIYSILINYKNMTSKKYIPLYVMVVIGIVVVVIQRIWPEMLLITWMFSYVSFIMYFTIENPDVKMIQELDIAKNAAENANHAKSDFLSNMSHEIRTPLNAIVGFSECILNEETLDDAKNDAKDIKLASENLLEIVNGILDISKIEANKLEIIEKDYNPKEVFENIAKLVKPRIGEKPIDFQTYLPPDLPYKLHGDEGKLKQIITNLLTNAAKYTDKGEIKFVVSCVNEENKCSLIISVEDTGRGIRPESIDKLFTKFQRLDEDRNTTIEGTGLGLALTKKLIEMMGGKIVVQSQFGEGSRFTVYISQDIIVQEYTEEQLASDVAKKTEIKDLSNSKVLVVDDNQINIKVALKLLSNYGIKADSVQSGFECLDKVEEVKYDLILLDDMMPKMSGTETLQKLKEKEGFKTPTVALTANAITGMKEKYLNDGFNDYLAKPIEKTELERVLKEYL